MRYKKLSKQLRITIMEIKILELFSNHSTHTFKDLYNIYIKLNNSFDKTWLCIELSERFNISIIRVAEYLK